LNLSFGLLYVFVFSFIELRTFGAIVVGPGYHFALSRDNAKKVFAVTDPKGFLTLFDEFKNSKDMQKNDQILENKRTWDAIHRALTEGELDPQGGEMPLNHVILGGKPVNAGEDYFAAVVRPDLTPFLSEALHDMKESDFRQKYFALQNTSYSQPINEKEYALVWHQVQEIRSFLEFCSEERFAILFVGKKSE
jgi:Domain of unknown function (DUF1877)